MTDKHDIDQLIFRTAPQVSEARAARVTERVMRHLGPQEELFRFTLRWLIEPLGPAVLGGALAAAASVGVAAGALIEMSPDADSYAAHMIAGGGF